MFNSVHSCTNTKIWSYTTDYIPEKAVCLYSEAAERAIYYIGYKLLNLCFSVDT